MMQPTRIIALASQEGKKHDISYNLFLHKAEYITVIKGVALLPFCYIQAEEKQNIK